MCRVMLALPFTSVILVLHLYRLRNKINKQHKPSVLSMEHNADLERSEV